MPVQSEWFGDKFEEMFAKAIGQELVKSAKILRRNLSTVLATTGKSPPSSPKGTDMPYNRTPAIDSSSDKEFPFLGVHNEPSNQNGVVYKIDC